ncbi:MAG: excinuclease ABC subunit UvrA [Planctomycetota bacterium]|nr:excinuclease ABC subunit UvrA [Planctomycetota bacterium]
MSRSKPDKPQRAGELRAIELRAIELRAIELRGACEHNLKHLDVDIPLHQLTVICGVSGSGKTSLALDTLYAEGQRRYIESFSAYARQFLARLDKPKFDRLENLPPTLAVTRSDRSRNNRSTVGTASDLLEPLRVVFSLIAKPRCSDCDLPIESFTPDTVVEHLEQLPEGRAILAFPLTWTSKSQLSELLFELQTSGWIRLIVQGTTIELSDDKKNLATAFPKAGQAYVVVERFRIRPSIEVSTRQSIELALERSPEQIIAFIQCDPSDRESTSSVEIDGSRFEPKTFSAELRCARCGWVVPPAEPRLFSFNSPIGACPDCTGFGETSTIDMDKIVPDKSLSVRQGAIAPWRTPAYNHELQELIELAPDFDLPLDEPVENLTKKDWDLIQQGSHKVRFGGLHGFFAWLERKKYKMHIRVFLTRWKSYQSCGTCHGRRLSRAALAYRYDQTSFEQWTEQSIDQLAQRMQSIEEDLSDFPADKHEGIRRGLTEVLSRLRYLQEVGLGYVTLSRTMHTLSGGEAQRVNLTNLLGSDLVDMLYVLDEPTVGLHPSDTQRIAQSVRRLIDRGNTVVLIEHEPYLLHQADRVIEIGPGAGSRGGEICFQGPPSELKGSECLTAKYLFAPSKESTPRTLEQGWLKLRGASGRNLKQIDLRFPLRCFASVVGVSGSGKSSLVLDTLVPAILNESGHDLTPGLPYQSLDYQASQGPSAKPAEPFERVIAIDQTPIAKSIRSCPATFLKILDEIRSIFGSTPVAKAQGLSDGHFSFNSGLGRCPLCEGLGFTLVDMQFMADVQLQCTECRGQRFRPEVLANTYRERNIAQVLEMSADDAADFFRGEKKLQRKLKPLRDIGLGYLPLGQSLSTLSAGESMRLKLASYLDDPKGSLIVMDEPTTGLHFQDVERLIQCIHLLIDRGNSILAIEHNEMFIAASDYCIELGPGAGPNGGQITYQGPVRR